LPRERPRDLKNKTYKVIGVGVLIGILFAVLFPSHLTAQEPTETSAAKTATPYHSPLEPAPRWENRGHWDFGLQIGYGVENAIPRNISHVNILVAQPHVGLIVHDFRRGPVRRFEIVNEGLFGNAVHPGGHMLGNSLFFRFDGKPRGNFMPFLNLGAGMMHTTLTTRVPEVSGKLQFMPQAGVGIQHFFSPQHALVIEYRYFHMSNAGITPPNHGFNGSMVSIGFRWLRRPPARH